MRSFKLPICALLLVAAGACNRTTQQAAAEKEEAAPQNIVYGINADDYRTETGEVGSGETLGKILNGYGVSALTVDRLDKASKEIFPLRNIRAGHKYTVFIHEDSLYAPHLDYLVYERNMSQYVVFGFHEDSVSIQTGEKEFSVRRTKKSATINSSLWGAIMEEHLPYALAAEMEDIYQWTVDFFGIQKGDNFTVIYDERFIDDSISAGIGRIWGAKFCQGGKEYYAIPFRQGGKIQYWEYDGGSLRKQMLKAPLKYTRISSKFTYARKHPIYKVYRPHRLRGAERHARTCRSRRCSDLQGLGRRRWQHAQNQTCRQPDDGLPAPERLCQGHLEGLARFAGAADRLRRFDGRLDRPPPRLPHLEKRHADQSAENPPGTGRTDLEGEPRDIRIRARPYRGRTERRGEGGGAHHATRFARHPAAGSTGGGEITGKMTATTDKGHLPADMPESRDQEPFDNRPGSRTRPGAIRETDSTPGKAGEQPGTPRQKTGAPRQTGNPEDTAESTGAQEAGHKAGVDTRIVRFLKKHHVLTLATSSEGAPYCCNAFYCYDAERNLLIFTSDMATRHAQQMARNPCVAASVVLETKVVGRVEGLQLCGKAARADEAARRAYLRRFPYAALAELTLWAIAPDFMKFTDNTLGFGKKLIWNNR